MNIAMPKVENYHYLLQTKYILNIVMRKVENNLHLL